MIFLPACISAFSEFWHSLCPNTSSSVFTALIVAGFLALGLCYILGKGD